MKYLKNFNENKSVANDLYHKMNKLAKQIGLAKKSGDDDKFNELKPKYDETVEKYRKVLADFRKEKDLEILSRCIKKEDMEDGAWYSTDDEGKRVARFSGEAQWIESRQEFLAPGQQQFGTDGYLDHWEDAIDSGFAGFPPMEKVERVNDRI